jgi:Serine aminopeptidase, S33
LIHSAARTIAADLASVSLGRHYRPHRAQTNILPRRHHVCRLDSLASANPGGLPKSVFDDLQAQLAANRSVFYRTLASGPFYGFNRPGVEPSEAIIEDWWRQGMMGGAKAHHDGIVAFSQTDFTEDLKKITVPVLVMHGDDDQIVPYADSGPLSARLLQNGTLKTYHGFPHGMPTAQACGPARPRRPRRRSCGPGWWPPTPVTAVTSAAPTATSRWSSASRAERPSRLAAAAAVRAARPAPPVRTSVPRFRPLPSWCCTRDPGRHKRCSTTPR